MASLARAPTPIGSLNPLHVLVSCPRATPLVAASIRLRWREKGPGRHRDSFQMRCFSPPNETLGQLGVHAHTQGEQGTASASVLENEFHCALPLLVLLCKCGASKKHELIFISMNSHSDLLNNL